MCYTDKKDTLKLAGVVVLFEGSLYTREEGKGQRGTERDRREEKRIWPFTDVTWEPGASAGAQYFLKKNVLFGLQRYHSPQLTVTQEDALTKEILSSF